MQSTPRRLRIIGGEWRSRQIQFADIDAVRPTPDRVRETLFNWLQAHIHGARCLEPFAGSGILSIEALSRGAEHCTILDQLPEAVRTLNTNLQSLGAARQRYRCDVADARPFISNYSGKPFDLIFLDPPFADADLGKLLSQLLQPNLLAVDGQIYVESGAKLEVAPDGAGIRRQKRAGAVHYALVSRDGTG